MKKWEEICSRCGLCCHEKVVEKDFIYFLKDTCEFFDKERRLCKVYDDRFKKCPRCRHVNIFRASFAPYLPSSCAYVIWAKRHHLRLRKDRENIFEV